MEIKTLRGALLAIVLVPALLVGTVFVAYEVMAHAGVGSSSDNPGTPPPAKATKARFVLVVGKSACGEDPSTAYINCHVAVRNAGGHAGGAPDVYVLIRYSDGGEKIIDNTTDPYSDSDQPGGFTIYRHSTRVIYLQHSYDATKHDLVQAAASLDLNAKAYPYITCTTC